MVFVVIAMADCIVVAVSHCNMLSATVFPKRFARSARLFSPFFDSLVLGCEAMCLSKLFLRAIYNATLVFLEKL